MVKETQIKNENNSTNNINVNVGYPKKRSYNKKTKPNWVIKAIVIGLIGLAITIVSYYITGSQTGKQGVIENGTSAVQPIK